MTPPPITSAQIPDEWIDAVRESAARVPVAEPLRAHPHLPRIQGWSVNNIRWHDLMLFGSGYDFTSNEERDIALARIRA
jgi:hypothetical protein